MMENNGNQAIAADRPATRPGSRFSDWASERASEWASERASLWASAEGLIPHLSASLALVRPVSMSEDAAAEWLTVAASELAGYRRLSVEVALSDARRRCTHHGQIIPHVIQSMEDANPWRMGRPLERRLPKAAARSIPAPEVTALIGQAARALKPRRPGCHGYGD